MWFLLKFNHFTFNGKSVRNGVKICLLYFEKNIRKTKQKKSICELNNSKRKHRKYNNKNYTIYIALKHKTIKTEALQNKSDIQMT